jgi:hypothetical protein
MPLNDEIYIGTEAGGVGGMVPVSSLGQGVYATAIAEGSFTVDPVSYSQIISTAGGNIRQLGWIQTQWHINGLRAEQYDAIIAYKVDLSTPLYIHTLTEDGATYASYYAKALFPPIINRGDPMAVEAGAVFDWTLRFIQMVVQP